MIELASAYRCSKLPDGDLDQKSSPHVATGVQSSVNSIER